MACGMDCSARDAAIAAAQAAVEAAQAQVNTMKECIEVYKTDIARLREIGVQLENNHQSLSEANNAILNTGTINGERVDKHSGALL